MENLFNPAIRCTDPDQLQFCLRISDTEFWYCEPNWFNYKLMPGSETRELALLNNYMGYPDKLLEDALRDEEVKILISNRQFWLTESSEMDDFTREEKIELLEDYGLKWDDFDSNSERNQIICENYFEQNPMDFRNDI